MGHQELWVNAALKTKRKSALLSGMAELINKEIATIELESHLEEEDWVSSHDHDDEGEHDSDDEDFEKIENKKQENHTETYFSDSHHLSSTPKKSCLKKNHMEENEKETIHVKWEDEKLLETKIEEAK